MFCFFNQSKRFLSWEISFLRLGLSIFGSVRFWTKINNQTNFFFKFLNLTKPKTGSNRLISVRFGFFPFQTGRFGSLLATQSLSRICTNKNRGLNPYQDLYKPKQVFDFNNSILIKPKQGFAFSNPILIKNLYINHGTTFYM